MVVTQLLKRLQRSEDVLLTVIRKLQHNFSNDYNTVQTLADDVFMDAVKLRAKMQRLRSLIMEVSTDK